MNSRRSSTRSLKRGSAHRRVRPHRERGIALVTVTWFLALLTLMAGTALSIARMSATSAANRLAVTNAETVADSAIRRAILSLLAEDARERWPINGEPTTFGFHGQSAMVRMSDESGRVDINGADVALLSAVVAANGVREEEALAVAARLTDWRDPDDTTAASGAERLEYRARGLEYGPRNGPFESVDEMWLVLGMPGELRQKLALLFTVYTGQTAVNEGATSPEVLAALRWADSRRWRERRWLGATPAISTEQERSAAGRVIRLTAEVSRGAALAAVRREAVVRITGNVREPLLVYSWLTIFPNAGSGDGPFEEFAVRAPQ